jgi:LysM repeat protein/ABC-type branched-subunit amino acid transport system substrate-binding protein
MGNRLFVLIIFLCAFCINIHTFAQEVIIKRSAVIENYKGKPYYMHFVAQGETVSGICRAYNVNIDELNAENPSIEKGLQSDMVLRIPQKPVAAITNPEVGNTEKQAEQNKPSEKPKETDKPTANKQISPKPQESANETIKQAEQVKTGNEKDYTLYVVKKQETLYGISHQYGLSVEDILQANPGFTGLKEGMELRIPKQKPATKPEPKSTPNDKTEKPTANPDEITVKTGETLYSISKTYNTNIDKLIALNPDLGGGLKAGMVIRLREPSKANAVKPIRESDTIASAHQGDKDPVASKTNCYNASNREVTYKIALLLPFLLDDAAAAIEAPADKNPSDFENFNYMQFYAGFMLAADSLSKFGLHANIQVIDADKLNDTLVIRQSLRKPGLDKMDLLVGPMYASSFTIAARFAKKNEIGIINPLSRRENIVDGNPYVIKTQSSGKGVSSKLVSFIASKYPNANVIVVRNDNKEFKGIADIFTANIKESIGNHTFKGTISETNYTTDLITGVTKKFKPGNKNVVVFFSVNKTAVPNFVSLLNANAKSNDILLIGMDGWDEFDLETEFLINLNFHQLTSNFVDYESEPVKLFTARFQSKYGTVPLSVKHAFLGYDIGWYFLTSLMWYGEDYLTCLPTYKGSGLQYNFDFSASKSTDGLQNQDITIMKLQDYKMVKVE